MKKTLFISAILYGFFLASLQGAPLRHDAWILPGGSASEYYGFNDQDELHIKTGPGQTVKPHLRTAISCPAGTRIKLSVRLRGTGRFSMGCHVYGSSNKWLGMVAASPVSINTQDVKKFAEFNIVIPSYGDTEVKGIRPFMDISAGSNVIISDFQCSQLPPAPDEVVSDSKMPHPFERLNPANGDFHIRILPSAGLVSLTRLGRPFIENANNIDRLRLTIGGQKTEIPFIDGKIAERTFPLPPNLSGYFTVKGEYLDEKDNVILTGTGYTAQDFQDLSSGRYVVGGMLRNAHLKNWVKPYLLGQKEFQIGEYPFQKLSLNETEPLPGFQNPVRNGNEINIWGRTYRFAWNALPEQVNISQPEPTIGPENAAILAAPISLELNGKTLIARQSPQYQDQADAVTVKNSLFASDASFSISSRIESDGVIRLDLKMFPGKEKYSSLTLKIPLNALQATLFHDVTDISYRRVDRTRKGIEAGIGGHAGYIPEQKINSDSDLIWQSINSERTDPGSFTPFFWFGNEDRGFCYFADSDRGWLVDSDRSSLELERRNDQIILNIHLINQAPAVLKSEMNWTVGLLATPVKAPMKHWRGTIFPRWSTLDRPFYNSLKNLRKLVMVSAGDPAFTNGTCSILPQDWKRTQGIYEQLKDKLGSTYLEYWCSDFLNMNVPEMAMYFGEWSGNAYPEVTRLAGMFTHLYTGFDFPACSWINTRRIVPSYLKYRLWCIEEKLKRIGSLAFYEDNMHIRRFYDPALDYGHSGKDGKPRAQFDLWSVREYYKNIARIYQRNGLENLSGAHSSAAQVIPAFTYCTFFIDGEQPARYDYLPDKDYIDHWRDLDYLRAHVMGRQFGINSIFLAEITYPGEDPDGHHTRAWIALIAPHDIGLWDGAVKNRQPVKAWHKIINDLDFYHREPRFYPYWSQGEHKIARHAHPDLLVTVWKQADQALIMLSNLGETGNFTIELDTEKLGLPAASVKELEYGDSIQMEQNRISMTVPRHDYRLILLKP